MMGPHQHTHFDDDDFLQDIFESDAMEGVVDSKTTTCIQHNYNPGVHISPQKNTSENSFEEKINRYENRSKIDKNQNKKSTPKFISNKNGCMEKYTSDDSFEFEDDSLFDNFYTEEKDNINPFTTSTPPDSEFTQILNPKISNQVQINNDVKVSSVAGTDTVRKKDFRYRLLQTLKENNLVSSVSHSPTSQSPHSQTASCSKSPEYMVSNDRKRSSVHQNDINEEDGALVVKKQYIKSNIPNKTFNENFSTPRTISDTAAQKRHTQTLPLNNNQFKTNTAREVHLPQYQQPSAPSSSPVNPPVKGIRKTVSPGGPVIRKRKFPGPAGILPQLGSNVAVPNIQELHEKTPSSVAQDIICSQNSVADFSRGPWQQMINDLELDQTDLESPLHVFNIKWVLRRASLRGQAGVRKVPFLAVIVRNLDVTCTDATAVLKDPTGEMNGTIAGSVMDEYGPSLQPGSVLLLRGVTVLSPVGLRPTVGLREHNRRHYLNITLNTVLTIYTPDESGHVITTSIEKVDTRELCKQAAAPETAGGPRAIVEEEEEEGHGNIPAQNHSLFSNVNDSHCQFRESASSPRIPNYRSPRSASNNILPCSSGQPQTLNQRHPQAHNMQQHARHLSNNIPRVTSSNFNGKVMSPRPPTTVPPLKPPCQKSPIHSVVPAICNRPSGSGVNTFSEKIKSLSKCNFFSSQAEEQEISDLLDGVDADSLFGDF
ncbi:uncharacterized protein [Procambarus clarkii]|uniref:uncharacterized protein n=1 Tax=Procambarus clarkii TaxID=6728 RepID=UPI001E672232|nr:uncharacterized protein LOC123757885 [Procambarus clarkii]